MKRADALFEQLQAAILAGEFGSSGDRFITVRDLAKRYACSFRCALDVFQKLLDSRILRMAGKRCCITTGCCPPGSAYGKYLSNTDARLFGVLLSDNSNPFFGALINHLRDVVYSHGMELIISGSGGDLTREKQIMDMFVDLKCRGVFNCVPIGAQQQAFFSRYPLPIVTLAEDTCLPNTDAVLVDNHAAGMQVAGHLLECGCRSFAYITLDEYVESDLRLHGFCQRLAQDQIVLPEENIGILPSIGGSVNPRDVTRFITDLLNRTAGADTSLPIGIFCVHDLLAVEVMQIVKQYHSRKHSKLRIPTDVMLVGFDDLPIAPLVSPAITTVSYRYSAIAGKATEVMLDYLNHPNHRPDRYEIQSSLIVRESTCAMGSCRDKP